MWVCVRACVRVCECVCDLNDISIFLLVVQILNSDEIELKCRFLRLNKLHQTINVTIVFMHI